MQEHKVGETFQYGDVLLRVERDTSTEGCACANCYCGVQRHFCCGEFEKCAARLRKDKTSVIFKEVEQCKNIK